MTKWTFQDGAGGELKLDTAGTITGSNVNFFAATDEAKVLYHRDIFEQKFKDNSRLCEQVELNFGRIEREFILLDYEI